MKTVIKIMKYGIFVLLQACAVQTYSTDNLYTITDGKVDENTYQGWQVYQDTNCGLCHGDSGQAT